MSKPGHAVQVTGRPIEADTLRAVARELEKLAALVEGGKVSITSESGIYVKPQCNCGDPFCTRPGILNAQLYYNDKETCH